MASRTKALACGLLYAGIAGSKPNQGMDVCFCDCVSFQVQVSVSGCSLVQRSPTECGVYNRVWSQSPVSSYYDPESGRRATVKKREKFRSSEM